MATNQLLPFATAGGANVLAPADYQALASRLSGFSAGVASSEQLNTVWRQASIIAALIGQFVGDIGGFDALDDGSVSNLLTSFERTVQGGKLNYATAGGTANALTAAMVPAPAALTTGLTVRVNVSARNTGAATLNLNGLGAVSIFRLFTNTLNAGDIDIGLNEFTYDGTVWRLNSRSGNMLGALVFFATVGTTAWVCPAGVQRVKAYVTGAGGGGAHSASTFVSGGGGAGATAIGYYDVVPGTSYNMTIGGGGVATTGLGGTGGTSSFASFASATGGGGGQCQGVSGCAGGASGTATGGQLNLRSGWGGDGNPNTQTVQGGQGGSSFWGGGSRSSIGAAVNAVCAGSGGGGGWGGSGLAGNGADGVIVLEYVG